MVKLERRGKYPGVKVHFDKEQCLVVLAYAKAPQDKPAKQTWKALMKEASAAILALSLEDPKLLEERTEAEIIAELEVEQKKSEKKLKEIAKGSDWKKVKADKAGLVTVEA